MAASARDDEFDEYDKPGAERSRRRRGEDDDLDSDLEEDLLEEDWLSTKKNPSDLSDEELNDDLLQSDEEDQNISGQGVTVSMNASLGQAFDLQEEEGGYPEDHGDGTFGDEEGYSQEGDYSGEYEGRLEYSEEPMDNEVYQDEVLDIQINESLNDEFQVDDYSTEYNEQQMDEHTDQQEVPVEEGEQSLEQQQQEEEEEDCSQVLETEEVENEPEPEEDAKEESDEEDKDDEESGRLRFRTERKDATVVRLSDVSSKRRNIPETLELSEEAKADLQQFEERERQRTQGRYGNRGGGRGGRGVVGRGGSPMIGGRGVGGRGAFPLFGPGNLRDGSSRGRPNDQRPSLMHMGMQHHQNRMPIHHLHYHQPRHSGPRGSGGFVEVGGPLPQQPLQPLLPPHRTRRSPPAYGPLIRTQLENQRMMSPQPPSHSHSQPPHHQHQPKNIHINPHFRGPSSSPVQVPLMPPAQNQPRPAVGPQRFAGPADFQQHIPGNFRQQQRPPHPPETWRGPPPPHQDREPFLIGDPRFPGQHMFDQTMPTPLMNNTHPLPGQGPLSFPQSGQGLGRPGFGPLGLELGQGQGPLGGVVQREPLRANLPPQHSGPPGHPGPHNFVGHRQPFSPQQGAPFNTQNMPFGMQVQHHNDIIQPQSHSLPQHLEPLLPHQPLQQHPPHPHPHPSEQLQFLHPPQSPFRQQQHMHGGPRQMLPHQQNPQHRSTPPRPRMNSASSIQQIQTLPQRNSNLRELPIAPSNLNHHQRPALTPGGHQRLGGRGGPGLRPGLNSRGMPRLRGAPAGRGHGLFKPEGMSGGADKVGEAKTKPPNQTAPAAKPSSASSTTTPQDPTEDEETRQYRLKIEEQKRLREEILKRKEQRRQMQAGLRKKELLERLSTQSPSNSQPQNPVPIAQSVPTIPTNGTPQPVPPTTTTPRQNVKTWPLQPTKTHPQPSSWPGALQQNSQAGPSQQGQWQQPPPPQQQPPPPQQQPQRKAVAQHVTPVHGALVEGPGPGQSQGQGPRPGVKRTVMQRQNSTGSPQLPNKVRLVKVLGGGEEGEDAAAPTQQPQPISRLPPQPRPGPVRKVTMATSGPQQHEQHSAQGGRGMGHPQPHRLVVPVRGRGRGGPVGCGGHLIGNRQGPRMENLPCMVSIEGLSSSTTEKQLTNLLSSIGPIKMFTMLPQQRRAVAKFVNPQHAQSFQHSFHRHMIDLSHINVVLIDG
ncbi:RNA-binding protein 33 isoform X2 [Denticeps clupeoides]|uniref:RNA-binding protein 33 isoform X2 n=1 Tax=Denticeps clupeoides TaxID=299321 RepID=UPI0010A4D794|nr:RNA-binding protein 33 isoform X2 [Denticeps clupeoides]